MQDFKSVKRNRLSIENLEACLLGFQSFQTQISITEDMMLKYKGLWRKQINEEENNSKKDEKVLEIQLEKEPALLTSQNNCPEFSENVEGFLRLVRLMETQLSGEIIETGYSGDTQSQQSQTSLFERIEGSLKRKSIDNLLMDPLKLVKKD